MTAYYATFADFNNVTFSDWETSESTDFSSYLQISQSQKDFSTREWLNYVYTFIKETTTDDETSSGCKLTIFWDWQTDPGNANVTETLEVYKFRNNYLLSAVKSRIRGKGRTASFKFVSETGKNFNLLGWASFYTENKNV